MNRKLIYDRGDTDERTGKDPIESGGKEWAKSFLRLKRSSRLISRLIQNGPPKEIMEHILIDFQKLRRWKFSLKKSKIG